MIKRHEKIGLLVAKKEALTRRHLEAVDAADVPVCVVGMDRQPEFCEVMLEQRRDKIDIHRLEAEVLSVVEELFQDGSNIGAIVIECTDLPPFAHAIQKRFKKPVFDIVTLTNMVHESVSRRPYG